MAATIYEPLSTAHLKSCTVDFDSRPDKKAVNLVQYDQTIPVLCVSLKKGGTEYKVPSDADVNIRMDKRDGYHVYNPALGVNAERTVAYFAVTPQMSTGWGDYYPIVEITVGGGIAGSAPIWLHFDRNPLPENAIISSDEYKTIQQLLEDVKAVKSDTEAIKTATDQIKAQTEAVRDQAKGFADNAKNSADKAQTLVDGMPSDYSQAMKDIGTLKNQMQRAYPDDSTIGENPWSSKHIVDMLCPPLQESGNPVVCYPVAGYPLGVKAKWEPVQEGSGTPSPENIRPIKGRDSVKVERCGENLLDEARFPIIKNQNNIRTTSEMTLPAGTYTVCVLSVANGVYARGADVENTYDSNKHTFTLARQTAIMLDAYWSNGRPENDENIWLVKGNEWRPYTPYIGSTNTLTLPETVYGGEVDAVSGENSRTWRTITLTGEERSHIYDKMFYIDLYKDVSFVSEKAVDIKTGKSSHYPYTTYLTDCIGITIDGGSVVYISNGKYPISDEGLQEWKSYLAAQYAAGTPVQIAYKLAEPIPFTATGAQPMPALAGANTVLTDADSATVTGRADPIKRITDLEDAVASQT